MRRVILLISTIFFIASCSLDRKYGLSDSEDIQIQIEIVDSLLVNGGRDLLLCDISPDQKYILLYSNNTAELLVADLKGEIASQFTIQKDLADHPGSLVDRPIFYNDSTILAHRQKGIWAYSFKGELVWKIERQDPLDFWLSKTYGRNMYVLDPPNYFTLMNYDTLAVSSEDDSLYNYKYALKIANRGSLSTDPVIPLEAFSRFANGKGYKPSAMLPSNHVKDNKMVLSYAKEDLVYIYQWGNQSFHLMDTFYLNIQPFLLDDGKERNSYKGGDEGVSLGREVGEAVVRGVWFVENEMILVMYNNGIELKERAKLNLEKVRETNRKLVMPEDLSEDHLQLYKGEKKYGKAFVLPNAFSTMLHVDKGFIWFKKNTGSERADRNNTVFYKTKIIEKD